MPSSNTPEIQTAVKCGMHGWMDGWMGEKERERERDANGKSALLHVSTKHNPCTSLIRSLEVTFRAVHYHEEDQKQGEICMHLAII